MTERTSDLPNAFPATISGKISQFTIRINLWKYRHIDLLVPGRKSYFAYSALALGVMTAAIVSRDHWFLNFVHVICGVMWTGIDLFMGFVVGPILRAVDVGVRREIILRLVPKTLFLMPTLSIITGTTGWFLAKDLGFLDIPWPQFGWVLAALVLVVLMTIQGTGYLL